MMALARAVHLQSTHHFMAKPQASPLMTGQAAANSDQVIIKTRAGSTPAKLSSTQSRVQSELVLAADQAVAEAGICHAAQSKAQFPIQLI